MNENKYDTLAVFIGFVYALSIMSTKVDAIVITRASVGLQSLIVLFLAWLIVESNGDGTS